MILPPHLGGSEGETHVDTGTLDFIVQATGAEKTSKPPMIVFESDKVTNYELRIFCHCRVKYE